jgi:hypothetical protein
MLKVCECYDRWGVSSPDCEWGFDAKHGNEIYCNPCKPVAQRARVLQAVHKFRGKDLNALVESTDREWLASWIDVTCSCCGKKGVPTFNRFLCYECWIEPEEIRHEVTNSPKVRPLHYEEPLPNGNVKTYSSKDYTQEQLQALLQQ